jgi:hypothetical protein
MLPVILSTCLNFIAFLVWHVAQAHHEGKKQVFHFDGLVTFSLMVSNDALYSSKCIVFDSMVLVCSDDQILDDESEGMRIVAHPNENITRHLSENALLIELWNHKRMLPFSCWCSCNRFETGLCSANKLGNLMVSHVDVVDTLIELLWWLFVIPVLNMMWTLYNFWANLI